MYTNSQESRLTTDDQYRRVLYHLGRLHHTGLNVASWSTISRYMFFFVCFLISCFTSFFVFSVAVLSHSTGVVYCAIVRVPTEISF